MKKNKSAAALAALRWSCTTKEERSEHARKMAVKSAEVRRTKKKLALAKQLV